MKTLAIMLGFVGILAGCEMVQTSATGDAPARPFPDASQLKSIAINGYQATRHQAPTGLRVGGVQQANAFIGFWPRSSCFICGWAGPRLQGPWC